MTLQPTKPPRRELATVPEVAKQYRLPLPTAYQFFRDNPEAGVVRFGRKILIDVAVFDRFVRRFP